MRRLLRPTTPLLISLLCALTFLVTPSRVDAGAFVFSGEANGIDVITHPAGYTGAGGDLDVGVCIDPSSPNAAAMEISVRNIVFTMNQRLAASPNLLLDGDNDIPSGTVDFETTALHEVGHCVGLAHPNAASESGLGGANTNYTKATNGANNAFDLGIGPDGVRGSRDDLRGDDVNLHWFVIADNDPCSPMVGVSDITTMARDTTDLPGLDDFAANADVTVCDALGYPDTEAVMQQGARFDEDQRRLAGDDVRSLRLAMAGLDETEGTSDDYDLRLRYDGLTASCDVPLKFDNGQTGFAVCQLGGVFQAPNHVRITSARAYFNTGFSWHFNDDFLGAPSADPGGAYDAECSGATTQVDLDGTGSEDPEGEPLDHAWTTTCPGGTFDDATSATPTLTVATDPGCMLSCDVELTVTDVDGFSDSRSTTVSVTDVTSPALTSRPASATVECDAVPSAPSLTATDDCDADVAVTFAELRIDGSCEHSYVLERRWTATDDCGNEDVHVQVLTVEDTGAPALSSRPADDTVACDAVPSVPTLSATDACDPSPSVSFTETRIGGPCADTYSLEREWIAEDDCGNQDVHVQVLSVQDLVAPTITSCPPDTTVFTTPPACTAVPALDPPTAVDACSAIVSFSNDAPATFSPGVTTVTHFAEDACGNVSSCTQDVTVFATMPCFAVNCSKLQPGAGAGDGKVTLNGSMAGCDGAAMFGNLAPGDRVRLVLDGFVELDVPWSAFEGSGTRWKYRNGATSMVISGAKWKYTNRASDLTPGDLDNSDGVTHQLFLGFNAGEDTFVMQERSGSLQRCLHGQSRTSCPL